MHVLRSKSKSLADQNDRFVSVCTKYVIYGVFIVLRLHVARNDVADRNKGYFTRDARVYTRSRVHDNYHVDVYKIKW